MEDMESVYNPSKDISKKNTLFGGSILLQSSKNSKAVVIKTGFQTTKGNFIREILYPKKI